MTTPTNRCEGSDAPIELVRVDPLRRTPREQAGEYLTILIKGVLGLLPGGTFVDEMYFESRARESQRRFQRHVEATELLVRSQIIELRDRIDDFDARLAARAEDVEAQGVTWNYVEQAVREPMLERQTMLDYAHAAIADVRLSVAQHARVQRRLNELDPGDVLALYGLSRTYGRVWNEKEYPTEQEMRFALWESLDAAEALTSAGCVQVLATGAGFGTGARNKLHVTGFGLIVLRVLHAYCRTREPPFTVPGREVTPEMRTRDDALKVLRELHPGLSDVVTRWARNPTARYNPPGWWQSAAYDRDGRLTPAQWQPPRARGLAYLEAYRLSAEDAAEVSRLLPVDTQETQHGQPRDSLTARVELDATSGEYWVRIAGPHDLLRWLADDVGIRWF